MSTVDILWHWFTILIPLTQWETRLLGGLDEELGEFINGRTGRDQERTQNTAKTCCLSLTTAGPRHLLLRLQRTKLLSKTTAHPRNITMESVAQTATVTPAFDRETFPRRVLRVTPRGASSHFVGSSIVILSSFAVSTLAMNCGKRMQESKKADMA